MRRIIDRSSVYRFLLLAIIVGGTFVRCDEAVLPPAGIPFSERYKSVTVQFNKSFENVAEGKEVMLELKLDKAATQNLKFELAIETNAVFSQHFITDPVIESNRMVVLVLPGESTVSIKFRSLNNITFDQGKYIKFTLSDGDDNIHLGQTASLTLIIEDDEAPSIASFAMSKGSIDETAAGGMEVTLLLSSPATGPGKIFINSTQNFIDFTTDVPYSENGLELEISKGDTSVGFKVFPIYNSSCSDKSVLFTMVAGFGAVKSGADNVYGLTISDSGDTSTISIAGSAESVNESNVSGTLLHIDITPMARDDYYLYLNVSGDEISNRFLSNPPVEGDSFDGYFISLFVPRNSTGADIKIMPVNDSLKNGNHQVDFSLYESNLGSCVRINSTSKFQLTIIDDE